MGTVLAHVHVIQYLVETVVVPPPMERAHTRANQKHTIVPQKIRRSVSLVVVVQLENVPQRLLHVFPFIRRKEGIVHVWVLPIHNLPDVSRFLLPLPAQLHHVEVVPKSVVALPYKHVVKNNACARVKQHVRKGPLVADLVAKASQTGETAFQHSTVCSIETLILDSSRLNVRRCSMGETAYGSFSL